MEKYLTIMYLTILLGMKNVDHIKILKICNNT